MFVQVLMLITNGIVEEVEVHKDKAFAISRRDQLRYHYDDERHDIVHYACEVDIETI